MSCSKHSSAALPREPALAKSVAARATSPRRRKKRAVSAALVSGATPLRRATSPSMPCRIASRNACPCLPAFPNHAMASAIESRASNARARWNADAAKTCSRLGPEKKPARVRSSRIPEEDPPRSAAASSSARRTVCSAPARSPAAHNARVASKNAPHARYSSRAPSASPSLSRTFARHSRSFWRVKESEISDESADTDDF
mmetsp:Transcript_4414/g.18818  ORF Transcript_4414/g.18818 Transcript_4414/m.18818 type:complete len:201 (+) Transcript_4414:755-1357(+)